MSSATRVQPSPTGAVAPTRARRPPLRAPPTSPGIVTEIRPARFRARSVAHRLLCGRQRTWALRGRKEKNRNHVSSSMYDVCAGPSRLIVAATDPRRRVAM
jgi:hypothetical protein